MCCGRDWYMGGWDLNGGGSGMVGSVSCFWKDLERVVLHRGRLDLRQWELEANITFFVSFANLFLQDWPTEEVNKFFPKL